MKHFVDIEQVRPEDIQISEDSVRRKNVGSFEVGDIIQITTKIDGSNSSFTYEDGKLQAFSRKKELDYQNTLNGFWNWVQSLNAEEYKEDQKYIFYGKWEVRHTVKYREEIYNKFYFYDIWNKEEEKWMPQDFVKEMAAKHKLNYINEWYYGEFISWEHVESFLDKTVYAINKEEGVVIKNMTKLNSPDERNPFYLKFVNPEFRETQLKNHIKKVLDPQKLEEQNRAEEIMKQIVTYNRVQKEIHKMMDEELIPKDISAKDMKIIAQNLPKRIYEDCVKEEPELVAEAGEFGGKKCNSITMQFARQIILG